MNRIIDTDRRFEEEVLVQLLTNFRLVFANVLSHPDYHLEEIILVTSENFQEQVSNRFPGSIVTNNKYVAVGKVISSSMFLNYTVLELYLNSFQIDWEHIQTRVDGRGIIFHEFGHICYNYKDDKFIKSEKALNKWINHYHPIVVNEYLAESFATRNYYNRKMLQYEINSFPDEFNNLVNELNQLKMKYRNQHIDWESLINESCQISWMILMAIGKINGIENNLNENSDNLRLTHFPIQPIIDNTRSALLKLEESGFYHEIGDLLYEQSLLLLQKLGVVITINEQTKWASVNIL